MAYSVTCLKFVVLTFSVIFAVSGVALLVFTSANLVHFYMHSDFVPTEISAPVLFTAITGLVACTGAILGWFSAMAGNVCRLHMFSLFLLLIIGMEFGGGIWMLTARAEFENEMTVAMEKSFSSYSTDENVKKEWKSLQKELECCGVDGVSDYRKFDGVDWSCCVSETQHDGACQVMRQRGCRISLSNDIRDRLLCVALLTIATAIVQISGVLCSCCLTNSLKNEERRKKYSNTNSNINSNSNSIRKSVESKS